MTGLSKAHYHTCNINQLLWITFTITGYYSKYPLKKWRFGHYTRQPVNMHESQFITSLVTYMYTICSSALKYW